MKALSGKKAVITGGSDGIGFGIAKAFADNGADVLLIARDPDKLKRASAELARNGVEVKTISTDLSDASAVEKISDQILAEWSELRILVNNAGIARFTPFSEVTESEFALHLNMNVKVPYLLTQRVLPALEKAKGSVKHFILLCTTDVARKTVIGLFNDKGRHKLLYKSAGL